MSYTTSGIHCETTTLSFEQPLNTQMDIPQNLSRMAIVTTDLRLPS